MSPSANSGVRSERRLETRRRQQQAVELRLAGATFDAIAERVGYANRSSVSRAIDREMEAVSAKNVQKLRDLEGARLDRLQIRVWADATGPSATPEQRANAVRTVLRIMERRAKLLGLDVPVEFILRLEGEQVDFMEGALRRVLDGISQALVRAGHADLVEAQWDDIVGQVVVPELESLAAAAERAP